MIFMAVLSFNVAFVNVHSYGGGGNGGDHHSAHPRTYNHGGSTVTKGYNTTPTIPSLPPDFRAERGFGKGQRREASKSHGRVGT